MADFRKISVLVALVLLIASAASAQDQGPAFSCQASAAVPPTVRAEGLTELVGDIVLQCTGGRPTQIGLQIPRVNFTIFLNTAITSKLIGTQTTGLNSSEALLLIDEPNTAPGNRQFGLCATPLTGCGVAGTSPDGLGAGPNPYTGITTGATQGQNVYRGLVSGNQVQFIGVPVDAPGTSGFRILRFTNIRANANGVSVGPSGTPGTLQALISATASTSLPINNPTQIVGYVQPGMTFAVKSRTDLTSSPNQSTNIAFGQCSSLSRVTTTNSYILQFTEGFPSSFKLQRAYNDPSTGLPANTVTASPAEQDKPGSIYNTESGFFNQSGENSTFSDSIASSATRFKAVFNNIPAGVNVFASLQAYPRDVAGGSTGSGATATLILNEGGSFVPAPASFTDLNLPAGGAGSSAQANVSAYQLPVVNGGTSAVWEVTGANPLQLESYNVVVWFNYTANVAQNTPPPGTATVSGSFAPTPGPLGTNLTTASAASATLPIPRFADGTLGSRSIFQIYLCRTNILFPYVTNAAGFDTGLAIANTSLDTGVFQSNTAGQPGTCTLFQFGDNPNPSKASPRIDAGKVWATLASDSTWFQANFTGYVIAQCQFQYAHGFAFVSDFGARNLAMGYLGLIMPDTGAGARTSAGGGEALDN